MKIVKVYNGFPSRNVKGAFFDTDWLVKDGRPGEPSTVKKIRRAWEIKK